MRNSAKASGARTWVDRCRPWWRCDQAALGSGGQGKSGGFRSILLFHRSSKAFFVYGFAKSDQDNIRRDELKAFRKLADEMLMLDDNALAAAVKNGTIMEIEYHG